MTAMASSISLSRFNVAVDRDLVASAIAGHEGGFEELVRRYQRPISAMSIEWWAIMTPLWI